jgi:hypothetical protein
MQLKHPINPLPSFSPATSPAATSSSNTTTSHSPLNNTPDHPTAPLSTTIKHVLAQLRSFPKGSACGRSGWRAIHLLQLSHHHAFLSNLTAIINLYLSGSVPALLSPFIVSGVLIPLQKKDGDPLNLRPIVVGEVFRRLISKLCIASIPTIVLHQLLHPYQLGVGTSGGVEAIIHSFNRLIRLPTTPRDFVITQIDFSNAFNEVDRNTLLSLVHTHLPQLYPWVSYCYSIAAPIFLGSHTIHVSTGVQQGDPLSSLLFALVLQPFLVKFHTEFHLTTAAFLDDVTLGGSLSDSIQALNYIIEEGPKSGLHLSPKTLIWSPLDNNLSIPSTSAVLPYSISHASGVSLLGGGISLNPDFFNQLALKRLDKCVQQVEVMHQLHDPQLELMLLRSCLGAPKLQYSLITSPPKSIAHALLTMESFLRNTLCHILANNSSSNFGDFQFLLASLPIKFGGLGISNPVDLSNFTYLASVASSWSLQNNILGLANTLATEFPADYVLLKQQFICTHLPPTHNNNTSTILSTIDHPHSSPCSINIVTPSPADVLPQPTTIKSLATLYYTTLSSTIMSHAYIESQPIPTKRRFQAIVSSFRTPSSSHYLFALPNHGLNQVMTKAEFHAHMAFRLLMPIFPGTLTCIRPTCHFPMDRYGYHALCCHGKSMFDRHELVAWALHHIASDCMLHPRWKAPVACLGTSWLSSTGRSNSGLTSFRPADILLPVPWDSKPTCVDITVVSPIQSTIPVHFTPGKAALSAEAAKIAKHLVPCELAGMLFLPFAVDIFGLFAPEARATIVKLHHLLSSAKGYPPY